MSEITPESLAASGTEHGHQCAVFCYAAMRAREQYYWRLLYAIPNGEKRGIVTAARLKAAGVKAGFPDIGLPVAREGYHALFIEMKRPADKPKKKRAGVLGEKQEPWHNDLREQGNFVMVCYTWQEAVHAIDRYLNFFL